MLSRREFLKSTTIFALQKPAQDIIKIGQLLESLSPPNSEIIPEDELKNRYHVQIYDIPGPNYVRLQLLRPITQTGLFQDLEKANGNREIVIMLASGPNAIWPNLPLEAQAALYHDSKAKNKFDYATAVEIKNLQLRVKTALSQNSSQKRLDALKVKQAQYSQTLWPKSPQEEIDHYLLNKEIGFYEDPLFQKDILSIPFLLGLTYHPSSNSLPLGNLPFRDYIFVAAQAPKLTEEIYLKGQKLVLPTRTAFLLGLTLDTEFSLDYFSALSPNPSDSFPQPDQYHWGQANTNFLLGPINPGIILAHELGHIEKGNSESSAHHFVADYLRNASATNQYWFSFTTPEGEMITKNNRQKLG